MGLILGKRDVKLARHAVKCYYGLDDGDGKIEVIENFDNKMPTGGFIKDITEELKAWWPQNIGMKSKVARLSESDFIYCVNELRAKNGSPPIASDGNLHKKWMECLASNDPHIYLVAIRGERTKLVLVNTKVTAQSRS
ncbi:MAG: hypothetical protein MUO70_06230 [Euryarchaeota archaeon]|jgi:hypothetical protein|nr:hypothetical protein [Euryarchaeota archaeon]